MIWRIAKKDFLLNLMTFKFAVGTVLCIVLVAAFMPVLVKDYQERLEIYNKRVADNNAELKKVKVYKNITPTVYRPPALFSVFSAGAEKQVGDSSKLLSYYHFEDLSGRPSDRIPEISAASAEGNPYLSVFPVFDMSLIFKMVIGVLALLVAYDTVSGERERGTLKLILSGTVARYQVLFGKLLAGLMTLAVPVTIAFIVGVLILMLFPMVDLTGWGWARIGLMYIASLVFISAMYNIGLLFSSLARRSAISLVVGLFVWMVCAIVIPNGSVYLAAQVRPLEAQEKVDAQIASLREELEREIEHVQRRSEEDGGGVQTPAYGAFRNLYPRFLEPPAMESSREFYPSMQRLLSDYAEKQWKLERTYLSSLLKQKDFAKSVSRTSPISLYENAMSALAGTDLAAFQYFMDRVRTHRNEVIEYIRSRTDNHTSTSFFTPCTEEEAAQFGRLIRATMVVETDEDGKVVRVHSSENVTALLEWQAKRWVATPSLDVSDLPRFILRPDLDVVNSVQRAIPDLALLAFFNVLFFALSFVAFLRYDVR
jgi:ABC-type transport system involved in multi-copper enzyme maturation permease subunit